MANIKYRPSIDGLRAVAVLSVCVFHLKRSWLRGGFVGVDIFFVISGYLITSILTKECETGSLSLAKFYQRRIARLLPAFFIVAVAGIIAAAFIYSPSDLAFAAQYMSAAAVSLVNMRFIMQGFYYFAVSPDAQLFLHCWSLSVEEQFYLIFPLALLLLYKICPKLKTTLLASAFVLSFIACLWLNHTRPLWAFYSLSARAWELLAGCLLAIRHQHGYFTSETPATHLVLDGRDLSRWFSLVGLMLIGISFLVITEGASFPGFITLLPVAGAVLVLAQPLGVGNPAETLLCQPFMVKIGKLSYSLYLWHWPIFSLVDYQMYFSPEIHRTVLKIVLTAATTLPGYYFVEKPGRIFLNQPQKRRVTFACLAFSVVGFIAAGQMIYQTNFLPVRLRQVAGGGLILNGKSTGKKLMLMGDSNAAMYSALCQDVAHDLDLRLMIISVVGMDPLPPAPQVDGALWVNSLAAVKLQKPDVLLLTCDWPVKLQTSRNRLEQALGELSPYAGKIILITRPPILPQIANRETIRNGARPPFFEDPTIRAARMDVNRFVASQAGEKIAILDVENLFSRTNGELRFLDPKGRQTYSDWRHLSVYGAALVKPALERLLRNQAAEPEILSKPAP